MAQRFYLDEFTLTSPAFDHHSEIPDKHTTNGENVSPALEWSGAPEGTVAYAVVCHDPDAPLVDGWTHWVAYGIGGDATGLEDFAHRFPTMARSLAAAHLDPGTDLLPVAPAAHYLCGGLVTDLDGATSLPGLWAAGETTCTGVHGANRLASNSLLEGLVFAPRAVEAIAADRDGPRATGAMRAVLGGADGPDDIGGRTLALAPPATVAPEPGTVVECRDRLQRAMTRGAGVLRDTASLAATGEVVAAVAAATVEPAEPAGWELRNLTAVAGAVLAAATAREESRGAHTRLDFPDTEAAFHHRLVVRAEVPAPAGGSAS